MESLSMNKQIQKIKILKDSALKKDNTYIYCTGCPKLD